MASRTTADIESSQPMVYQIRIKGHLGRQWSDWFEGLAITLEDNGETLLTGPVIDQAALHGLLKKVRDLGMPLISAMCVDPGQETVSDCIEQERRQNRRKPQDGTNGGGVVKTPGGGLPDDQTNQ
jgi:hypothetical protein